MIEETEEVKQYKSLLTTSKPYTVHWWIELLGHAIVRDTLSVERMQWDDADRYNKLVKFIHKRIARKLEKVMDEQRHYCSREYLESTYDSNNFEYKGKPLRNYVHDLIRNAKQPDIK